MPKESEIDPFDAVLTVTADLKLAELFDLQEIQAKPKDLVDAVECIGKAGDVVRLVSRMALRTREPFVACHTRADDQFPGPEGVIVAHAPYYYFRFKGRLYVDRDPKVLRDIAKDGGIGPLIGPA